MFNLKSRIDFWSKKYLTECQGDTLVLPDDWREYFAGRSVLEIGPGEGRQFSLISSVASKCDVADISTVVLQQPIYSNCSRFEIKGYDQEIGYLYDIITFWHVLHHILEDELDLFFHFVLHHLKLPGGRLYFNCPGDRTAYISTVLGSDGMKTTLHSPQAIFAGLIKAGFEVEYYKNTYYNCSIVKAIIK